MLSAPQGCCKDEMRKFCGTLACARHREGTQYLIEINANTARLTMFIYFGHSSASTRHLHLKLSPLPGLKDLLCMTCGR